MDDGIRCLGSRVTWNMGSGSRGQHGPDSHPWVCKLVKIGDLYYVLFTKILFKLIKNILPS